MWYTEEALVVSTSQMPAPSLPVVITTTLLSPDLELHTPLIISLPGYRNRNHGKP